MLALAGEIFDLGFLIFDLAFAAPKTGKFYLGLTVLKRRIPKIISLKGLPVVFIDLIF